MKRLITCSDGTWDKPDDTTKDGKPLDSNVCLFYQSICSLDANNIRQLKIYDTGVGTGFSLKDKILGGVTGMGIDKKIKNIYTFLNQAMIYFSLALAGALIQQGVWPGLFVIAAF